MRLEWPSPGLRHRVTAAVRHWNEAHECVRNGGCTMSTHFSSFFLQVLARWVAYVDRYRVFGRVDEWFFISVFDMGQSMVKMVHWYVECKVDKGILDEFRQRLVDEFEVLKGKRSVENASCRRNRKLSGNARWPEKSSRVVMVDISLGWQKNERSKTIMCNESYITGHVWLIIVTCGQRLGRKGAAEGTFPNRDDWGYNSRLELQIGVIGLRESGWMSGPKNNMEYKGLRIPGNDGLNDWVFMSIEGRHDGKDSMLVDRKRTDRGLEIN
ncbi:hypothetical protein V6N13_097463 [Hibiscus sabdariffa]|uniref:Uncharacterized protein n=1 Tax=Hibiscus sabdariffa TaxID=183260 RepID=A0ABR2PDJ3_9ROSI